MSIYPSRRHVLQVGLSLCATPILLGGRANAAETEGLAELQERARGEGKFLWYDAIPREQAMTVAGAFQARYPGVRVEYVELVAAQRISRIVQESHAGGPTADVFTDFAETIMKLVEQKLMREVDWRALEITPTSERTPNGFLLATHATPYVFLYNSRKVAASAVPRTYADTLRPEWKGRIGLWSVPFAFVSMTAAWSTEAVESYARDLTALAPRLYSSPRALAEAVGAGEMDAAYFIPLNTISDTIAKGAPVEAVWIEPTAVGPVFGALPKAGANPSAGKLFLVWLASPEGAAVWERATGRGNPFVEGTTLNRLVAGKQLSMLSADVAQKDADRLTAFGASIIRTLQGR